MFKGRKIIRGILMNHLCAAPLWECLKLFKFTVAPVNSGYTVRLVGYGNQPIQLDGWDAALVAECVAYGTYYYDTRSGYRSITFLVSSDLAGAWDTLPSEATLLPSMLNPTTTVDSPVPVQIPPLEVQERQIQGALRVRPPVPNWSVPHVWVGDLLASQRDGRTRMSYRLDLEKLPKMFYARVSGSDPDLSALYTSCKEIGVMCSMRKFSAKALSAMPTVGPKSVTGTYAIITNMIMDQHCVLAKHVPLSLTTAAQSVIEKVIEINTSK